MEPTDVASTVLEALDRIDAAHRSCFFSHPWAGYCEACRGLEPERRAALGPLTLAAVTDAVAREALRLVQRGSRSNRYDFWDPRSPEEFAAVAQAWGLRVRQWHDQTAERGPSQTA